MNKKRLIILFSLFLIILTIYVLAANPSMTSIVLNATTSNNLSTDNLTVYVNGLTDGDGDNISLIYDWRVEGDSIALLNMPFDHNNSAGENKTKDYSLSSNNGTLIGGVFWNVTGGQNQTGALEFDGVDDKILIDGTSLSPNASATGVTFALWIKTNIPDQSKLVIFKNNNWRIAQSIPGAGSISFLVSNGSSSQVGINSAVWTDTSWNHFVFTLNTSGHMEFYKNGASVTTYQVGGTTQVDTSDVYVGAQTSTSFFNGTIDSIKIFNRSLSSQQVKALYNNQTNLIVSQETNSQETWSVILTPNDGSNDGTSLSSDIFIKYSTNVPDFENISNFNISEDFGNLYLNLSNNISDTETSNTNLEISYTMNSSGLVNIAIDNTTNNLTISSITDQTGSVEINLTIIDEDLWTNLTSFILTVEPANDAPEILNFYQYPLSVYAGNNTYIHCNLTDPETNSSLLNVTIEYKSNSSSTWLSTNETFLEKQQIYSVGDSITAGHPGYDPDPTVYGGDDPINSSYQYWLDTYMNSNASAINGSNYSLYNKGVGSKTCDYFIPLYDSLVPAGADYVILLCGINDIAGGGDLEEVSEDLTALYNKSIANNNTPIMMTIIPHTTQAYCDTILSINTWIRNFTSVNNVTLVDLYPKLNNGADCYRNLSLYADAAHPNVEGYRIMGETIWEEGFNKQYYESFSSNITIPSDEENSTYDFRCLGSDGILNSSWAYNNSIVSVTALPVVSTSKETSSSSSSSSGGGSTSSWGRTYVASSKEFADGYLGQLKNNQRVKFKFQDEYHHVGVKELTNETVTISVESEPQEATLAIDESKSFELDGDEFYDVYVKLNDIQEGKAILTIRGTHMKIPGELVKETEETKEEEKEETIKDKIKEINPETFWPTLIAIIGILSIIGLIIAMRKHYVNLYDIAKERRKKK